MSQSAQKFVLEALAEPTDPSLIRCLRAHLSALSGNAVKRLILEGKVFVNGLQVLEPTRHLQLGDELELRPTAPRVDRLALTGPKVHYLDQDVVVVEKPSGLLTVPYGEEWESLIKETQHVIPRMEHSGPIPPLRPVHRLDKEASGLVAFARHVRAQRALQEQFADHSVERVYLALVLGELHQVGPFVHRSRLVSDRGDGLRGSGEPDDFGKDAVTHFEVLEVFPGVTLLRCQLETGRTHQIRIHCAELGHPLVGESVYIRDFRGQKLNAPRLMLHATRLGFLLPRSGQPVLLESPLPELIRSWLKGLRRGRLPGQHKRRGSGPRSSH